MGIAYIVSYPPRLTDVKTRSRESLNTYRIKKVIEQGYAMWDEIPFYNMKPCGLSTAGNPGRMGIYIPLFDKEQMEYTNISHLLKS